MTNKMTFIGAGNMSSAIFGGLIQSGFKPTDITATSPETDVLAKHERHYGIHTTTNNKQAIENADIVILAVKPQILKIVCEDLADTIQKRKTAPLIISIAAGISADAIDTWLGGNVPIVRCMPNTPALIGFGASGLFANRLVTEQQKTNAGELMKAVGIVEWVQEESLLNAVTAVSGSAPAYFFMMFEAMEAAAVKQGLTPETARRLAQQTALGAAKMALTSKDSATQLKKNVMSPQGSTEQAIFSFERDHLTEIVDRAMQACANRALEMQEEFGK